MTVTKCLFPPLWRVGMTEIPVTTYYRVLQKRMSHSPLGSRQVVGPMNATLDHRKGRFHNDLELEVLKD